MIFPECKDTSERGTHRVLSAEQQRQAVCLQDVGLCQEIHSSVTFGGMNIHLNTTDFGV